MMKKILHNPQALIGLALIALVTAVALLAPVLAPHAPDAVNLALKYQPASSEFPLGTDQLGRCELSRLLYGARASLGLALPILVLLGAVGLGLGLAAAAVGWSEELSRSVRSFSPFLHSLSPVQSSVCWVEGLKTPCWLWCSVCGRALPSLSTRTQKQSWRRATFWRRG